MGCGDFFRDNWRFIAVFALIYSAIFFAFFPSFWASIDEHGFVKNAVLFSHGKTGISEPEYACRAAIFNGEEYLGGRFAGRSLFIIPFLSFGMWGVMLSGLAIHLLNFLIVLLILKKLGVRKEFSIIYLFLPTFVWASRTVYADFLVVPFFLASIYFYLSENSKSWIFSGVFAALAVFVRPDAGVGAAAFFAAGLVSNRKKILYFAAPLILFAVIFMGANTVLYGNPLSIGSGAISELVSRLFVVDAPDLIIYSAILLVCYPLLLAALFLEKKTGMRNEFFAFSIAYLALNASFTEFSAFDFSLASLFTSRLRYLIPLIGILIIPYSCFLDSLVDRFPAIKNNFQKIFLAFVILAVLGAAFESSIHASFLNDSRKGVMDLIYSNTPEGSLIVGSSDDCMYFVHGLLPDRKYLNINLKQDLAGNPKGISIIGEIKANDLHRSYLLILDYAYLKNRSSSRAGVVNSERKMIIDFYEANKSSFDIAFEDKEKGIAIYSYNGGALVEG